MKKMFFLVLILLAGNFSLVAKISSEKEIRVSGFDGKKPLEKFTIISVSYPESPEDWYLDEAYKGETKDSFLKRITSPVNGAEIKKFQVYKPALHSSANLDKEEIGFIQNPEEKYHLVYRRPPGGMEKRRYLSLEELEDSLMMAETNFSKEEKPKTGPVPSVASQEQKKFKESYWFPVTFFAGLILFFILFGRIPLIWSTKNKK